MVAAHDAHYCLADDERPMGLVARDDLGLVGTRQPLQAQTDEIQVYVGDVENPGKSHLTFHANYTPRGRSIPGFPGGSRRLSRTRADGAPRRDH
jgi:hypothetical protein